MSWMFPARTGSRLLAGVVSLILVSVQPSNAAIAYFSVMENWPVPVMAEEGGPPLFWDIVNQSTSPDQNYIGAAVEAGEILKFIPGPNIGILEHESFGQFARNNAPGYLIDASAGSGNYINDVYVHSYADLSLGDPTVWDFGESPDFGYLGFRMDAGGGDYNYGWARFVYFDPANIIYLFDYAYEQDVNVGIAAGQQEGGPGGGSVPEPSTVALAAAGLLILVLRRIASRP